MRAPRVALVGARRRRQGLGPFVARHLLEAGAEIPCFVATSATSAKRTEDELRAEFEIESKGYVDADEMLREQALDALAILSPHETHAGYLEKAVGRGLACLCEKPLVWGGPDPVGTARKLVDRFEQTGTLLFENCQLPYLLETYWETLFPDARTAPVERFEARLSPTAVGERALLDSLHHPLSLLQTLAPLADGRAERLRFDVARGAERIGVRFRWPRPASAVEVEITLQREPNPPRTLGFAVNGAWADRQIRGPGYEMFLRAGETSVPVLDPEARLVRDFVQTLRGEPAPALPISDPHAIVQRMELLAQTVAAFGRRKERT